jgi:glycosyltransferase involved in cell wall biosynthesis
MEGAVLASYMKILFVNSYDSRGGAAKASIRIFESVNSLQGLEASFIVKKKESLNVQIKEHNSILTKINFFFEKIIKLLFLKNKKIFSFPIFNNSDFFNVLKKLEPDLIHMHWVNDGFIQISDLMNIEQPILWTLHDDWPFTGGCHLTHECTKYIDCCNGCPHTRLIDITSRSLSKKKKIFNNINLSICSPSQWLMDKSLSSNLFKNFLHFQIPNPINIKLFYKNELAEIFSDQRPNKIILFGAHNFDEDSNKGFKILLQALSIIDNNNFTLAVFGNKTKLDLKDYSFKVIDLGKIYDEKFLIDVYSSADFIVAPSLQENFSNIILESMSCSLPVIAFNVGGNSDLILHKVNGYLCKNVSYQDLADGIKWMLHTKKLENLSTSSRKYVEENFTYEKISFKYLNAYKKILSLKNKKNTQIS